MLYVKPEELVILDTNLDDTNKSNLLDLDSYTQAEHFNDIDITLQITAQDWISFINLEAVEIQMTLKDMNDNIIKTYDIKLDDSLIFDIWGYFYNPLDWKHKHTQQLFLIAQGKLEIKIINPNKTAKVGAIVLGRGVNIGLNEFKASVGIRDYTSYTYDSKNNTIVAETKKTSDLYRVKVYTEPFRVAALKRRFEKLRQQQILWIGSRTDEAKILFGFFKAFEPLYTQNGKAVYTLELEGVN